MPRRFQTVLVSIFLLMMAVPALAQEAPPPAGGGSVDFSHFFKTDSFLGTIVIWCLMFSSFILVALIIQAFMQNRKTVFVPPELLDQTQRLLDEKNFRGAIDLVSADKSPFGEIMASALAQAPRGYTAMEQALEETSDVVGGVKIRKLVYLEIAGAAGPMLGLFGTVFGMIVAFSKLVALGGAPKPAELAGGIATALVCTFWGLVVGIPGVTFSALFRVKIEGLMNETLFDCQRLIGQFRPATGGAKKPSSSASSPATPKPVEAGA